MMQAIAMALMAVAGLLWLFVIAADVLDWLADRAEQEQGED